MSIDRIRMDRIPVNSLVVNLMDWVLIMSPSPS